MKLSKRFIGMVIFITLLSAIMFGGAYSEYLNGKNAQLKIDTRISKFKIDEFTSMCCRMYACKVYDEYDKTTGKLKSGESIEDFKSEIDSLSDEITKSCFDFLFMKYNEEDVIKRMDFLTSHPITSKSDLYKFYNAECSNRIMNAMNIIVAGK